METVVFRWLDGWNKEAKRQRETCWFISRRSVTPSFAAE